MGNDGGSIPKRVDMVRVRAKAETPPTGLLRQSLAAHCALSCAPLQPPVAVCRRGMLYSRGAVVVQLLQGAGREGFEHIAAVEDVREVDARLRCALSGAVFNGGSEFVCLWGCGCLLERRALDRLGAEGQRLSSCPVCDQPVLPGAAIALRREAPLPVLRKRARPAEPARAAKRVKAEPGLAGLCGADLQRMLAVPTRRRAEDLLLGGTKG